MNRPIQAHGLTSKVYTPGLLAVFRRKIVEDPDAPRIEFTLKELREELDGLGLHAANLPDLIYRMGSRTRLPDEIQDRGFRILIKTGRGAYALLAGQSTLIDLPEVGEVVTVLNRTPLPVQLLLGDEPGALDEQGMLSVVRYNDLITHFLRAQTFHLKAHIRKSVPGLGQAEVDDLHLAVESSGAGQYRLAIVPVEAKARNDPVNRAQIASQIRFAQHEYPGLAVRPVAIKLFGDGTLLFMEFNATTQPNELLLQRFAHYRLRPTLPSSAEATQLA